MSSVYKNRQIQPRGGRTGESQSYIGEPSIFGAISLSPTSVSPICYQKPAKSVGQKSDPSVSSTKNSTLKRSILIYR
jgi:hypothetical protein